jgi:hypothetical protein
MVVYQGMEDVAVYYSGSSILYLPSIYSDFSILVPPEQCW